jgi:hypothetical protein
MTMSIFSFVTLIAPRRFSSRFAEAVSAIWSDASLAHELTVWQNQRHVTGKESK